MTENNKDSFWETKDDFWNSPVASDDWLKSDTTYITDTKEIKDKEEKAYENPYMYRETVHNYDEMYQQEPIRATVLNGQEVEKPKKKIHVHTIICLSLIVIAVLFVVGSFFKYSMAKKSAVKTSTQVDYTETEVNYSFSFDDNNALTFAGEAVSYVSEENFTGFPKDMKMIGIYLEVESDEYISGANVLRDIYLGYQSEGRDYYQKLPRQDTIYPYASSKGFQRDEILGNYGLGNGFDEKGYLFFFVPEDVYEVTLYMPKTVNENFIDVIETVFYVSFPVIESGKEAVK